MKIANEEIVCRVATGEVGHVVLKQYPNGEPLVTTREVPTRVLLRPSSMQTFVTAMFWLDALAARGHAMPELILPCVPGARQDRLNETGDVLFTLKSVAAMLNARKLPRVTVLDPHSDVTPALIERCRVVHSSDLVPRSESIARRWAAIIAPDGGAEKRAGAVAQRFGLPLLRAWKKRDVATGKLTGFGMQPIPRELPPGPLLVVDDLCDGGGTFIGLAVAAGLETARPLDLYVTHGLFSAGTTPLLRAFGVVICTDSVLSDKDGVTVIDACATLLMEG